MKFLKSIFKQEYNHIRLGFPNLERENNPKIKSADPNVHLFKKIYINIMQKSTIKFLKFRGKIA